MALKASQFIKKSGKGKSKDTKGGDSLVNWIGNRRAGLKNKKMKKGSKPMVHEDDEEEC